MRSEFTPAEMARAVKTSPQTVNSHCSFRFGMSRQRFLNTLANLVPYLDEKIQHYQKSMADAVLFKTEMEILKDQMEKED